jgi:predicted porin
MNSILGRYAIFWLALVVFFSPLWCHAAEINAGDWMLNIGGTLRISYNQEDCDDECQDIWRTTDTNTTAYEDSDKYLTGDISHIFVSGSRQMGSGMSAVFKTEWRIDTPDGDDDTILSSYDQYLGINSNWGLFRGGTMETPYMQTGNTLDPFSSDALSTRFFVDIQSALHHNTGKGRGRATNTLRYDSPISKTGITSQLFTSIDNTEDTDPAFGGGFIYTSQSISLFLQYYDNGQSGDDEAVKFGGKIGSETFSFFGQYEVDKGLISLSEGLSSLNIDGVNTADDDNIFKKNKTTGADVWFIGTSYTAGKVMLLYEYGRRKNSDKGLTRKDGHTAWVLGMSVHFDKYVYGYLGYLEKDYNGPDKDKDTRFTVGATLAF